MRREEILIPNQGHTLACMIRTGLFENSATETSCVVVHPQDTSLKVEIKHDNPKECLLMALRDARLEIEGYTRNFNSYMIQKEMKEAASMEV